MAGDFDARQNSKLISVADALYGSEKAQKGELTTRFSL